MKRALALITISLAVPGIAQTSFYKCTDDRGQPMFSDKPCGAGAETGTVESATMTGSVQPEDMGAVTASRKIRERERRIDYLEDRIDRFEREREARLARLRASQLRANNNLAGAQYRESLASEMQSVNAEYRSKIENERGKIDRYREEIASLREGME